MLKRKRDSTDSPYFQSFLTLLSQLLPNESYHSLNSTGLTSDPEAFGSIEQIMYCLNQQFASRNEMLLTNLLALLVQLLREKGNPRLTPAYPRILTELDYFASTFGVVIDWDTMQNEADLSPTKLQRQDSPLSDEFLLVASDLAAAIPHYSTDIPHDRIVDGSANLVEKVVDGTQIIHEMKHTVEIPNAAISNDIDIAVEDIMPEYAVDSEDFLQIPPQVSEQIKVQDLNPITEHIFSHIIEQVITEPIVEHFTEKFLEPDQKIENQIPEQIPEKVMKPMAGQIIDQKLVLKAEQVPEIILKQMPIQMSVQILEPTSEMVLGNGENSNSNESEIQTFSEHSMVVPNCEEQTTEIEYYGSLTSSPGLSTIQDDSCISGQGSQTASEANQTLYRTLVPESQQFGLGLRNAMAASPSVVRFNNVVNVMQMENYNHSESDESMDEDRRDFAISQSLCTSDLEDDAESIMPTTLMPIAPPNFIAPTEPLEQLDELYFVFKQQLVERIQAAQTDEQVIGLQEENRLINNENDGLSFSLLIKTELAEKLENDIAVGLKQARGDIVNFKHQAQTDLESAQLAATSMLVGIKDAVNEKIQKVMALYEEETRKHQDTTSQLDRVRLELADRESMDISGELQETIAMLEEKMAASQMSCEAMRSEANNMITKYDNKLEELNQVSKAEVDMRSEEKLKASNLDTENSVLMNQKEVLEKALSEANAQVQQQAIQLTPLQDSLANQQYTIEEQKLVIAKMQLQIDTQAQAACEFNLASYQDYYEKKIEELNQTIKFNEEELASTNEALKVKAKEHGSMEDMYNELKCKHQALEQENWQNVEKVGVMEVSVIENDQMIKNLTERMIEMGDSLQKLELQCKTYRTEIELKAAEADLLREELDAVRVMLNASEIAIKEINLTHEAVVLKYQELHVEFAHKSKCLEGAYTEIAGLTDAALAHTLLSDEHKILQRTYEELNVKSFAAIEDLAGLRKRAEDLEKDKIYLEAEKDAVVETSDERARKLVKDLEHLQIENNKFQIMVEAFQTDAKNLNANYETVILERDSKIAEVKALAVVKQDIHLQNMNLAKEVVSQKQLVTKLNEDMFKMKQVVHNQPKGQPRDIEISSEVSGRKKRPLAASNKMSAIPEDRDSPYKNSLSESVSKPDVVEKKRKRRESTRLDQVRDENTAEDNIIATTPVKAVVTTPQSSTGKTRAQGITMYIGISGFKENTAFNTKLRVDLMAAIKKLPNAKFISGAEGKDIHNSQITHIITPTDTKTLKALAATLAGSWIIHNPDWVFESAKAKHWLSEESYGFQLAVSPFSQRSIYVAPSFAALKKSSGLNKSWPDFLILLWVKCSGGVIVDNVKDAEYVIVAEEDEEIFKGKMRIDWHGLMSLIPGA